MIYNTHSDLVGKHAFLSPSKYHWLRYNLEKLKTVFVNREAARRGTELHALAHEMIRLGMKPERNQSAFSRYVRDGIGYRMQPELVLAYSYNCFGSADTLAFDEKKRTLRIHDYKSGLIPGAADQLEIYAGIFCLEYDIKPHDIDILLAIYQGTEPREWKADPDDILDIMTMIEELDPIIDQWKKEALS